MYGRGSYLVTGWVVLIACGLVAGSRLPAAAQNAKISAVVMDVTHRVGAGGSFVKSAVGAQLPPGSRVRTGRRSKCEIKFPSGSVIRMGERTDLVIEQGTSASLGYGRVYAKIIAGTAATISGVLIQLIPGRTIGYLILNSSVILVFMALSFCYTTARDGPRRPVRENRSSSDRRFSGGMEKHQMLFLR